MGLLFFPLRKFLLLLYVLGWTFPVRSLLNSLFAQGT
ncbi:hypothetical protein EDP1_4003 [Pseudomonas putida S610]|nr:hypothetical protein EDP1_4003 [Pseudomonas putida S610]